MKYLSFVTPLALFGLFAFPTVAQKPRRMPAPPKVVSTTNLPSDSELRAGVENVGIQIKNVTKFIFILGGVASGIESIDKDPKANKASLEANAANKQAVMQAIRNLRAGLATLEVDFRVKPSLKKYLPQIQGITELAAQSEDLAAASRFSDSGKPLLLIVEKLADTLVAIH